MPLFQSKPLCVALATSEPVAPVDESKAEAVILLKPNAKVLESVPLVSPMVVAPDAARVKFESAVSAPVVALKYGISFWVP